MGDWMTVTIVGTIDPADVTAARAYVNIGERDEGADWDRFHCLCYCGPSLCGLGMWIPIVGGDIYAVGNLSERNYDPDDVAKVLRELALVAPSLELKVHCGGSYESTTCVATVTLTKGEVFVGYPEIPVVGAGLAELVSKRVDALFNRDTSTWNKLIP